MRDRIYETEHVRIKNHHRFSIEKQWWFPKQLLYFSFSIQLFKEIT